MLHTYSGGFREGGGSGVKGYPCRPPLLSETNLPEHRVLTLKMYSCLTKIKLSLQFLRMPSQITSPHSIWN